MGVQGDGIRSSTNDNPIFFMEVVDNLVTLSRGNNLNQPEAGDTIDKWSRELCQWMEGRKAVKNGGRD